jgi:hypothetical protein
MMFLLRNSHGFSMIQGMMVAAVLAGSSLVATKLLSEQKKIQRTTESRDQVQELHEKIYSIMQNRDNCFSTVLAGNTIDSVTAQVNGSSVFARTEIISPSPSAGGKFVHFETFKPANPVNTTYMNNSVTIESIQFKAIPTQPGDKEMVITYERLNEKDSGRRTKSGFGGKRISKTIMIKVQLNRFDNMRFQSCYAFAPSKVDLTETGQKSLEQGTDDLMKELCIQLSDNINSNGDIVDGSSPNVKQTGRSLFVWDDATNTCIPNAKCPDHMIFTGIDSTGRVKCREPADWIDYGSIIGPTQGDCTPPKNVRLRVINPNPLRVSIECY